jgi:hypothetical protein
VAATRVSCARVSRGTPIRNVALHSSGRLRRLPSVAVVRGAVVHGVQEIPRIMPGDAGGIARVSGVMGNTPPRGSVTSCRRDGPRVTTGVSRPRCSAGPESDSRRERPPESERSTPPGQAVGASTGGGTALIDGPPGRFRRSRRVAPGSFVLSGRTGAAPDPAADFTRFTYGPERRARWSRSVG